MWCYMFFIHARPFLGSIALGDAYFGEGVGIIYFDELECTGTEPSLANCTHNGVAVTDCFHNEDASVLCQGMALSATCTLLNFAIGKVKNMCVALGIFY